LFASSTSNSGFHVFCTLNAVVTMVTFQTEKNSALGHNLKPYSSFQHITHNLLCRVLLQFIIDH